MNNMQLSTEIKNKLKRKVPNYTFKVVVTSSSNTQKIKVTSKPRMSMSSDDYDKANSVLEEYRNKRFYYDNGKKITDGSILAWIIPK